MRQHKIVIIGAGNVGYHLAHEFKKAGHRILQIFSRSVPAAEFLAAEVDAAFTDNAEDLEQNASLYVLAVKDDSVEDVAELFFLPKAIVVHTSAMIAKEVLEPVSEKFGVFYPLQTMTKGHALNFQDVPVFIEASDEEVKEQLWQLANSITPKVFSAGLQQRQALHAAAVFVNNFTNHLFYIAENLLKKEQLSLEMLKPLINETVRKLDKHLPLQIQTGPARRGDMQTVEKHLEILKDDDYSREIYLVITESIINSYRK